MNILTYAGDRSPSGINIPNYYDVRENDGFKNVIFEDGSTPILPGEIRSKLFSYKRDNVKNEEISDILNMFDEEASAAQTAGHELFGHGSGKLIYKNEQTQKCPFSVADPLNKDKQVTTCYDKGQSYNSVFSDISSSYEECRADLSGLYLATVPKVYKAFGFNETNSIHLLQVSLMEVVKQGIHGLVNSYNPELQKWKQAHT